MQLKEIKMALLQTECGEFLRDGMGCSEPLPVPAEGGILDLCFLYMYDRENNVYSAPVARIGFFADRKEMIFFDSCYEHPFSAKPEEIFQAALPREERLRLYPEFERLYDEARPLFYQEACSAEEKKLLLSFSDIFEACVDPSQRIFYRECAPMFFAWLSEQVSELLKEDYDAEIRDQS